MKIASQDLLDDLKALTEWSIRTATAFRTMDINILRQKPTPEAWNALECLDHLCQYGDHYLPAIERGLLAYRGPGGATWFQTGVLGGYFAGLMKSKDGKVTKLKAPKGKVPVTPDLPATTVDRFLKQQEELLRLLDRARGSDLRRIHVATSLSPLIRLRLGDTFRFYVYHIERHVLQAQRAIGAL